jgi:hypothetical protein
MCLPAENATELANNIWSVSGLDEDNGWSNDKVGWGNMWTSLEDPENPGFSTRKTGSRPLADPILTAVYDLAQSAAVELCKNCCTKVRIRFFYIGKKGNIKESPGAKDIEY